jgi:protein-disulfide isomerase
MLLLLNIAAAGPAAWLVRLSINLTVRRLDVWKTASTAAFTTDACQLTLFQAGISPSAHLLPAVGLLASAAAIWLVATGVFVVRLRLPALGLLGAFSGAACLLPAYTAFLSRYPHPLLCPPFLAVFSCHLLNTVIAGSVLLGQRRSPVPVQGQSRAEPVYLVVTSILVSVLALSMTGMLTYGQLAGHTHQQDPVIRFARLDAAPTFDIPIGERDPQYGTRKAPYPLVIFSDFQCPGCRALEKQLKLLVQANPGLLKLVYKHYPLSTDCNSILKGNLHPMACQAARAASAAFFVGGNDAFWEYGELLFTNQKHLNNRPWLDYAKRVDLDLQQFEEQLAEGSEADIKVLEDLILGIELKLGGITPHLFFLGKRIPRYYFGAERVFTLEDVIAITYPGTKVELRLPGPINAN